MKTSTFSKSSGQDHKNISSDDSKHNFQLLLLHTGYPKSQKRGLDFTNGSICIIKKKACHTDFSLKARDYFKQSDWHAAVCGCTSSKYTLASLDPFPSPTYNNNRRKRVGDARLGYCTLLQGVSTRFTLPLGACPEL